MQTPRGGKRLAEFEEQNESPGAGSQVPQALPEDQVGGSDGLLGTKGNQQAVPEQGSYPVCVFGGFHGSWGCRGGREQAGAPGKENGGQEMHVVKEMDRNIRGMFWR